MNTAIQPVARIRHAGIETLLYPGQKLNLGRSIENDIVIDEPKVSRAHASLEWNGTGFTLRDLGSVNGTFVNGQRLTTVTRLLRDGDTITLSEEKLQYEIIRAEPLIPLDKLPGEMQPAQAVRGPRLVVAAGPDKGQEYPLWGEQVTIGRASRDATWEIRLTDRSISRPHARLEKHEGQFYLVDLESVNGTLRNGSSINGAVLLAEVDTIKVGETELVFHTE